MIPPGEERDGAGIRKRQNPVGRQSLPSAGRSGRARGGVRPERRWLTTGGLLSARYVIHTVGPVWRGGEKGEPDILGSCYRNCLRLAAEKGLQSIAFPSIGTGAYGYPVEEAAPVALSAVATFLRKEEKAPGLVRFVLFNVETLRAYHEAIEVLCQFPRAPASRALGSRVPLRSL